MILPIFDYMYDPAARQYQYFLGNATYLRDENAFHSHVTNIGHVYRIFLDHCWDQLDWVFEEIMNRKYRTFNLSLGGHCRFVTLDNNGTKEELREFVKRTCDVIWRELRDNRLEEHLNLIGKYG